MTSHDDSQDGKRHETLTRLLDIAQDNIRALRPPLQLDITKTAPSLTRDAALVQSWQLLSNGVAHLDKGGPLGKSGGLAGALEKASLRVSSLAAAFQVPRPRFTLAVEIRDHSSGHEEAVFLCRRLIEAATDDRDKSIQLIRQHIVLAAPQYPMAAPEDAAIRRQAQLSLNIMGDAYMEACKNLRAAIYTLPSPAPDRGPRFKF